MSFNIIGTGSCYPNKIVTNDDLSKIVDTSDEWISTRTGVKERRICAEENITQLATNAAKNAILDAGIDKEDIDLIICATIRGDYVTPSLGCIVQKEIEAKCPAFDINAACSGFIYALDVAAAYLKSNKVKNVLVVAAESMSKLIDWSDRATCVLFGDGAGAVVLSGGEGLLSIKLTAKGNSELLNIKNISGNSPFSNDIKEEAYISMNGQEVYKFAVSSMINDITAVINEAGIKEDDIDFVLPHQANMRIIEGASHRLKIPKEKYYTNLERFGNTSAASIPILLDELNKSKKIQKGDILVFSAFGGGLTTGACVLRWMIDKK